MEQKTALQAIRDLIAFDCTKPRWAWDDRYIDGNSSLIRLSDKQAQIALSYGIPIGICSAHDDYHGSHKGEYSYSRVSSMDEIEKCRKQRMYENHPSIDPRLPNPQKMLEYIGQIMELEHTPAEQRQSQDNLITEKLYSPIFVQKEEYHDGDYWNDPISQREAVSYEADIHKAILRERMPDEEPRGLMTYYHVKDSVDTKVRSLYVDVEIHADRLWGVATIEITEPLTPDELDKLRDYITGQYSDGFGEGFEQRGIKVGDGELYVSLWESGDRFFIAAKQEFEQRLGIEIPGAESRILIRETYAQKSESDEKPSVLDQIRRAREKSKTNPAPTKATIGKIYESEI